MVTHHDVDLSFQAGHEHLSLRGFEIMWFLPLYFILPLGDTKYTGMDSQRSNK